METMTVRQLIQELLQYDMDRKVKYIAIVKKDWEQDITEENKKCVPISINEIDDINGKNGELILVSYELL